MKIYKKIGLDVFTMKYSKLYKTFAKTITIKIKLSSQMIKYENSWLKPSYPFPKPSDDLLKLPDQFPKSEIIFQVLSNDF